MIELVRLCEKCSATILVKRGMQHAIYAKGTGSPTDRYQKRFGDQILPSMPFDEVDAQRKVRELAEMIKCRGNPTYFITFTCNQPRFPGVAQVHKALQDSGQDPIPWGGYLQRVWHRSTRLLLQWLANDDSVLGSWTDSMSRYEFQDEKANLSHIHMLAWTDDPVNDEDEDVRAEAFRVARSRVTADIGTAFAYIEDVWRRGKLESLAWDLLRNKCGPNCLRPARDGGGEMVCRLRLPKKPCHDGYYHQVNMKVGDDAMEVLLDLGLATRDATSGRVDLHYALRGGEHFYTRGAHDHCVSVFSPEVFEVIESHMNAQVVDNRFMQCIPAEIHRW